MLNIGEGKVNVRTAQAPGGPARTRNPRAADSPPPIFRAEHAALSLTLYLSAA
jgi:hypothetical protein